MLNFIANWRSQRTAVRELSRLSDHHLADLGIARVDIEDVVARAARQDDTMAARPGFGGVDDWMDVMGPSWATHNRLALAA